MTLMNVEKAGYYPLPPEITPLIAGLIAAPNGGRILDPCVGKGAALHTLAQSLQMEPYGVELNESRAAEAEKLMGKQHILQDSYQNLRVPKGSFNLLYENPPYLIVEDKKLGRAEYMWLRDTRPFLQPGGLLIWVVPRHMLRHRLANKYLATWFDTLRVYKFPYPFYQQFKQVIVFGIRKSKAAIPDPDRMEKLRNMATGDLTIPDLRPVENPLYTLPPLASTDFYFRSIFVRPETAVSEANEFGLTLSNAFNRHLSPTCAMQPLSPLAPLKIGHMNSVIAAGHLNNQVLEAETMRLLIKGHSFKRTIHAEAAEPMQNGRTKITHTHTEQIVTKITTLTPDGEVKVQSDADLEGFLSRWLPHLTDIVATGYPPRYQFNLNGYGDILGSLNQKRTIPLVGKPGLLPAQAHAAAAIATQLETHKAAIVVGEMGTGKTLIGTAVAACLHAKHTIVLCPPHLVDKWIREVKITWPVAEAMALKTISDVDEFFAHPGPIVGVLKETTARSASGWSHAFDWFGPATLPTRGKNDEWDFTRRSPHAPATEDDLKVLISRDAPIMRTIRTCCPYCGAVVNGGSPQEFQRKQIKCSSCRSPLYQDERRRTSSQKPGSFARYVAAEKEIRMQLANHGRVDPTLRRQWYGTAVSDHFGYARYPLATYILRHYKRRLDLLLGDELHQFKGAGSDRGYAFQRLVSASRKVVGLTGTIYGGKASSLFHLLYRLVPEMKQQYTHRSVKKWVEHFGIMQSVETAVMDEDGKLTGNARSWPQIKELPGGSPAMLPWLLNRSVFVSLQDMGFALPGYEEIPVPVSMSAAQQAMYETLKEQLIEELKERLIRNDKSLLAGYLQALLNWPDSPWRSKVVRDPRTEEIVAEVPGLPADRLYPKEERIITQIQEELKNGRNVLLLCQQTGTLDITPQWTAMLGDHNIQSAVLKCEPSKREKWVKKQVEKGVQVIITHPKRIETGLDLLHFPTIIWMGTEYSVYTVLQASRRSWRIGQTEPVKVYFYAYEETLQEDALSLIAAKVAATLRVNGDTVANDSLAELDSLASTDIVTALARIVTGQDQRRAASLQDAFRKANEEFRSGNTIIGDYEMVDLPETAVTEPVETACTELVEVAVTESASSNSSLIPHPSSLSAPNGASSTKSTRLVFGQDTADKNGRVRKSKTTPAATQLSLFG